MKTKNLLTLSLLLLAGTIAQAAPLTVAVYDFKGDGEAAAYGHNVTTLVTADLTTETNLVMVERSELNKALNEQALGVSGMVDSGAAAKIGQLTGAKVLVAGQVIQTGDNHLIIVASIISTETGRLFAAKVAGAAGNLMDLTSDLSRKIAQTITDQATNLVTVTEESHTDHVARIINSINGTNRPSVSVSIARYEGEPHDIAIEGELGAILMKAGFKVVDGNSDQKPEIEISGACHFIASNHQGKLYSSAFGMDVKIQERRTGNIIAFDRQENSAVDDGPGAARTAAQVKTVDALAGRILPLLAQ